MTLPGAILYASAIVSGLSALWRPRLTTWPLLASLGLCLTLQMPFDLPTYVLIDCVVIWLIASFGLFRRLDRTDYTVICLFPVAWVFYCFSDPIRFWGGWAVVVTQFLACVPWTDIWHRAVRTIPRDPWDMFDLRVRGVAR